MGAPPGGGEGRGLVGFWAFVWGEGGEVWGGKGKGGTYEPGSYALRARQGWSFVVPEDGVGCYEVGQCAGENE